MVLCDAIPEVFQILRPALIDFFLLSRGFCSLTPVKLPRSRCEPFQKHLFGFLMADPSLFSVPLVIAFIGVNTIQSVCSPPLLSGIKVLVIGVIIPLYADSLSLNPLRSTLCHAWLTCLRWCQVLAVSRRLPYATVLLSPLMSVKWMSARVEDSARRAPRNTLTVTRIQPYCTNVYVLGNKRLWEENKRERLKDERITSLIQWWWSGLASRLCWNVITHC